MKKIVLSMLCASANIFYAATLRVYNKTTMPVKVTITYSGTSKTDTIKPNDSSLFNSWFYDIKTVRWDEIWSVTLDMPAGNTEGKFTIYDKGRFESTRKEELGGKNQADRVGDGGLMIAVRAVREGNLAKVKELVAKGAEINPKAMTWYDEYNFEVTYYPETNALNEAVKNKDKTMIKFLIESGADPNAKIGKFSPMNILKTAMLTGDIELVKLLVENGAKPDADNLKTAIGKNYFDIVQLLIEKGASIRGDSLQLAIDKNYFDIAKYLIDKGAAATNVALNHAAYLNNKAFAEYLINVRANVNEKDKIGEIPLIVASKKGARDVAQLLINKGAEVNATDNEGNTALIKAAMNGYTDIVKMLIDAGADVTIKNKAGETAYSIAIVKGYTNIAKMLEEAEPK